MPNTRRVPRRSNTVRTKPANENDGHLVGDKVGVKVASRSGARGLVARVRGAAVVVALADGETIVLPFDAITNFSRAARRAWKVMPKRAGRPRAEHPRKKMVSLRLDLELIERLDLAVRLGRVANRSQAVADGVSRHLDRLRVPRASSLIPPQSDESNGRLAQ